MASINVLVLEPPYISNVGWWRLYTPFRVTKELYPGVFNFTFKRKDLDYADAWNADIIVQARPGSGKLHGEQAEVNNFIKLAKRIGGTKFILDIDDHILDLPRGHKLVKIYENKQRRDGILECLQLADEFWFSTPTLRRLYAEDGQVMKNAIFPEWLPDDPAPDRGIFVWRGADVQIHDLFSDTSLEAWPEVRDGAKLGCWLGYKPPLPDADKWMELEYISEPDVYLKKVLELRPNLFWKPMLDCPFNDAKSNIALLEATMAGGVCLTNYAGRPGWENAAWKVPTYSEAVELWTAAKADILQNYNLVTESIKRAERMILMLPHLKHNQNAATG